MTARVFHADLWGTRKAKYDWLNAQDVQSVKWTPLKPNSPHYFFVPRDETLRAEYEAWPPVTSVFPRNVTGIVTARDGFAIDFDDNALLARIGALRDAQRSDADIRDEFFAGKGSKKYPAGDSRGWKLPAARTAVQRDRDWRNRCVEILYRPFDVRRIYYVPWIVDWPRPDLMPTMLAGENLGLTIGRQWQVIGSPTWDLAFATKHMTEFNFYRRGGNVLLPVYLYPLSAGIIESSPWPAGKGGRRPNLTPQFIEEFSARLGLKFVSDGTGDHLESEISNLKSQKSFGPEDIFHYAYAVFHSPTYRSRYAEFLKIDFPRLPLTSDKRLFARLCELGAELVGLHLLERVPAPAATYPQPGGSTVEKPRYKPPTNEAPGRVYVNGGQYFENVPPQVWEFHVGGYQVCEKWLKDRKGRSLGYDDIETYRRITEAIRQTVRVMTEIDRAIPGWPLT